MANAEKSYLLFNSGCFRRVSCRLHKGLKSGTKLSQIKHINWILKIVQIPLRGW